MSPLYVVTAVVATYICFVEGQSSCNTPSGGAGECKSIYGCEQFLTLINKKDRTPQDLDLLRKSQCGFEGNTPKVCCPNPCRTPEGNQGNCVNLYNCPHLSQMLQPPVPKDKMEYVQNSRCQGTDPLSVCCGPPPDNNPVEPTGDCSLTVSAFPPDPRTECCGVDSRAGNKIVGGTATAVDQYPWLVLIEYTKDNQIKLLCGGALISGKYVLTAGHCVAGAVLNHGTPKNVRLSEYDTSNEGEDCAEVEAGALDCTEGILIIPIERTIPHPGYNPNLRRNDIALIRLKTMAPFTDFIRPICLPSTDITTSPPANFTLFAAGWGAVNATQSKSNTKLHVGLPFENLQTCQAAYRAPGRMSELWDGQMCAGGQPGKDSCKGDSGGPLMYVNEKITEVLGVVSFGPTPCGLQGIPGVYTKVFKYNEWIRRTIQP